MVRNEPSASSTDPYDDSHTNPAHPSDSNEGSSSSLSVEPHTYPFPFHRLPSELLVAIFQVTERSSRHYNCDSVPLPVILSRVCHLWRNVAINAATLWTDIRICDHSLTKTYPYPDAYFERSKSSLIDVHFHLHVIPYAVLNSILLHVERVRRLTIIAQNYYSLQTAMGVLKEVAIAPCLESFRVSLLDFPYSAIPGRLEDEQLPFFAGGAPLLRSVQVNGIPCIAQPQFKDITSFTLRMGDISHDVYLPHFLGFLTNIAQTLIQLRVWDVGFYSEPNDHPLHPVVLPLLESLDLSRAHILPYLQTPRLQKLYMKDVDDETLETFVKLSSSWELSKLQSLKLDELLLSYFQNKTEIVRGMPLLTELMIWDCMNDEAFLNLLEQSHTDNYQQEQSGPSTESAKSGIIMPHLRSLTLSVLDRRWPLVQAIIEDRITKGVPLDCVRSLEAQDIDYQKEVWLMERGIGFEYFQYDEEENGDVGDSEWISDELHFEQEAIETRDDWEYEEDYDSDEDYDEEISDYDSDGYGEEVY
jgi:F-box-like